MDDDDIPQLIETAPTVTKQPQVINAISSTEQKAARVPLTILTGFLGAGKSTLLRRILTGRHGYRIAVIMNEFGDTADLETVNISSTSNSEGDLAEEVLELANGCLCCSIKDIGIASIEKLMEKKGAFDYILLETTGLADPAPVAALFWQNEEYVEDLSSKIALDGVICVVDAVFGLEQIAKDRQVKEIGESLRSVSSMFFSSNLKSRSQLACADVVLLNKCDLATPGLVSRTEDAIRNLNASIPIYRTIKGELPLELILNLDAFHSRPQPVLDYGQKDHEHAQSEHDEPGHDHFRGVSSVTIPIPILSKRDEETLDDWVRKTLWEGLYEEADDDEQAGSAMPQVKILRCKGLYWTKAGDQVVIQGVQTLYETTVTAHGQTPQLGKLVLIGTGLGRHVTESFPFSAGHSRSLNATNTLNTSYI